MIPYQKGKHIKIVLRYDIRCC